MITTQQVFKGRESWIAAHGFAPKEVRISREDMQLLGEQLAHTLFPEQAISPIYRIGLLGASFYGDGESMDWFVDDAIAVGDLRFA